MTKIINAKRHGGITNIALFSSMIYPLTDVNKVQQLLPVQYLLLRTMRTIPASG